MIRPKNPVKPNTPAQYRERQYPYMDRRWKVYANERGQYASNYFHIMVQGLDPDDFYRYMPASARFADVGGESMASTRKTDDFKDVYFTAENLDYIPIGAKIEAMGSVWLSVNPMNISDSDTKTMVCRCNASYRFYDDYGNIVKEPLRVDNADMYANENDDPENMVIPAGNFRITAQRNPNTERLGLNQRIVLGRNVFVITGYAPFFEEFYGERGSEHLLTFTARLVEATEEDDLVRGIANDKEKTFSIVCEAPETLPTCAYYELKPSFCVNGIESPSTVHFTFKSENNEVYPIDGNGLFFGNANGENMFTIGIEENPDITLAVPVVFSDMASAETVEIKGDPTVEQYLSAVYTAHLYVWGVEVPDALFQWEFSGADRKCYYAVACEGGRTLTITCNAPSAEPLLITAKSGEASATVAVALKG